MMPEAESLAQDLHESLSIHLMLLTGKSLPTWLNLPYAERSALTRAIEEVLEGRIARLHSEVELAERAARFAERNEENTQDKYDNAIERAKQATELLDKARYATLAPALEAIGKAIEVLKNPD